MTNFLVALQRQIAKGGIGSRKRRGPRSGKDRRWLPAAAQARLDEAKMAMKESCSVLNNVNFDRIFAICQKIVIFDR